jgi:putative transposase
MKFTVAVKLAPTPEQHAALLAMLERFNTACNAIADTAFRQRLANKIALQKLIYYDVRERFGLSSQMTVRAIAKVVEAYKRDRSVRPVFRPHGALTYDERIMTWKGLATVSLLTLVGRQLVSMRLGVYQTARWDQLHGQADLTLREGVFYLCATLDVPDVPIAHIDDYLGVDLGIVNLAADSDGRTYTGESIDRQRRRYAHRRRNLQRKRTRAAKRKLQRIGRSQARFQRDSNHCISKALVRIRSVGRLRAVQGAGMRGGCRAG